MPDQGDPKHAEAFQRLSPATQADSFRVLPKTGHSVLGILTAMGLALVLVVVRGRNGRGIYLRSCW